MKLLSKPVGASRYRVSVDIEWTRSKLTKYLELEQACRCSDARDGRDQLAEPSKVVRPGPNF
jgi:hypothetical protein